MDSLSDYDYELPNDRIAQSPMNPRENAKLLILQNNPKFSRDKKYFIHKHIRDFPSFLLPTDVLVLNNTKVFKARLLGVLYRPNVSPRPIELFLLRPNGENWIALAKPGKAINIGNTINIEHKFTCTIVTKNSDGTILVSFGISPTQVTEYADRYGSVPVPPYIKKIPDAGEYQTAYAKIIGSAAAPTAGFHITSSLLKKIQNLGVTVVEITLHVGLGTFQPIRTDNINSHHMHSEWVDISEKAAETINTAKAQGRRIIAVGTTTTRALEGAAKLHNDKSSTIIFVYQGDVDIFITPGFQFRVIDGLLTNFHLPKTTLLLMISAFAASHQQKPDHAPSPKEIDKNGRQRILAAYKEAIRNNYRFYSFGDAMLIV